MLDIEFLFHVRNSHCVILLQVVRNETGHYSTELFTQEAVNVIKNHDRKQPLFLYVSHQAAHAGNPDDPLQVPERYTKKLKYIKNESRRKYAGKLIPRNLRERFDLRTR